MLNNKDKLLHNLLRLGLTREEALVYLCLLRKPQSHLEVSRETGINRTKVYRIVDQLEQRSLVATINDDAGTRISAVDASSLEVELANAEQELNIKKAALSVTLPLLQAYKHTSATNPDKFEIATYDGVAGFKQMLWHELKAKGEILIFGSGQLEDLVPSIRWCEKHRAMTINAEYTIRELLNPDGKPEEFTKNTEFMDAYTKRELPVEVLNMEHQITIYNNTVATYCWRGAQKIGYEVTNAAHAAMHRQLFENYWELAS